MRTTSMILCLLATLGCNNNGGGEADTSETGGTDSGDTSGTSEPGTTTSGEPTSDSGVESTIEAPTSEPPGTSTEVTSTSEPGTTTDNTTSETSTTGEAIDCMAVDPEMKTPELFLSGFEGSEDLAFDGKGGLALKRLGDIVVVRADMSEETLLAGVPPAYGTRFLADGRLVVALPQAGKVVTVDPMGMMADYLPGTKGANGIFPDLNGDVWVTEIGGDAVVRVDGEMTPTTVISGKDAAAANGVVFDTQRGVLFFTRYQAGEVVRAVIDGRGVPGAPEVIAAIDGAPDGLTLDACGHLYIVDQGNSRLLRQLLDGEGLPSGEPSVLAEFPSNVANAQFGVGEGFDDHTLYLAGNPGDVYTLALEFAGAPIVTVQ